MSIISLLQNNVQGGKSEIFTKGVQLEMKKGNTFWGILIRDISFPPFQSVQQKKKQKKDHHIKSQLYLVWILLSTNLMTKKMVINYYFKKWGPKKEGPQQPQEEVFRPSQEGLKLFYFKMNKIFEQQINEYRKNGSVA